MSGRVFHAPLLAAHPDLELYGVLERNKQEAAKRYPDILTYSGYADVLADPAVDLVVVNVPDLMHTNFASEAILAGKHVVVEKPFTVKQTEAEQLISLAKQHGVGLYVFQNRRWDSDFLTIQRVIREGELGRITEMEAHYDRYRPVPPGDTWKEDRNYGTGILYNLGSHLIDQALVLFGMPEELYAELDTQRQNGRVTDYFHLILNYARHRVILKSGYLVKKQPFRYLIHGELGTFMKAGQDPQESRLDQGWAADDPRIGEEEAADYGIIFTRDQPEGRAVPSEKGNYLKFYDGVVSALRGRPEQAVSAREGARVVQIIELARESHKNGKKVKVL